MLSFIVVLTALAQGLVGLFVLQKKRNSTSNISFAALSVINLLWALINYFYTLNPVSGSALTLIRVVMFLVVIENTLFYIFAKTYPSSERVLTRRWLAIILPASAVVALLTLTPGVFKSVTVINNQSNPNPGPFIGLFMLHAVYTIGAGLRSLVHKLRTSRGQLKVQFQFILFASVLNWLVVPVTNFVITLVVHTTFFARVSPFYNLAFASIIAYAIVAQRLFDIRTAVARSVAYVLALGSLGLVYALGIFGVINALFSGPGHETTRQILSVVLIMPLVFSFEMIKRYFDALTNKIFYRNYYDNQEVLDRLGAVIVAEINLSKILSGTKRTLEDALKSSFVEFILIEEDQTRLVSLGSDRESSVLEPLTHTIKNQRSEIMVTDELGLDNPLKKQFSSSGVAVSLRLKTQSRVVGYILFGDKRGGDIYNSQDLRLLAIVADELAVAVQNSLRFEEIQRFNVTLQEKVDQATKQLRQANVRLKELDQTKDEFISMASHQLRTPLTTIKGYLSMVLDGDVGAVSKKERDMIQQAFDSAERMVFLIGDLLNVSRLQSGKFVIENKPTDLVKMVEAQVNQLKETAANHHLTLTYKKPEKFPLLNLDETKIQQVVMNFMDNAIYYTPAGGSISVNLEATDRAINYTVTDTGLGVPKAEQHHLFSKFYRAGNARKMRPDGTGLGLFMAKKVIVAQEGAIIFKSEEGKGSTFGFSFPRSKVEVKASAPVEPADKPAKEPVAA